MLLFDACVGSVYTVKNIDLKEQTTRRLEMLGMTKGSTVQVMTKKRSGSMVIKVRGTRFALGKSYVRGITVGEYDAGN